MRRVIRLLSSIKLTVITLILLAIFSGISTFVPQGESSSFYYENYKIYGGFILFIGLNNFFKSNLFLILLFIFFLNLLLCTSIRIHKEIKGKVIVNIGPDIIHLGILMLLICSFLSAIYNQSQIIQMKPGDLAKIDDFYLELSEIRNEITGFWISDIKLFNRSMGIESDIIEVEVNNPFRNGDYIFYQLDYKMIESIKLLDHDGNIYSINKNDEFIYMNKRYYVSNIKHSDYAEFIIYRDDNSSDIIKIRINETNNNLTLLETSTSNYSLLLIKREPLYIITRISLFIILAGFIMTYTTRIKWRKD